MSAGFEVDGEVFWGTNGAIEAYVEALRDVAAEKHGENDSLTVFFREAREGFSMGIVIDIDELLASEAKRAKLLEVFDLATERILLGGTFSDYGMRWAATVMGMLRRKLTGAPLSMPPPSAAPGRRDGGVAPAPLPRQL